MDSLSSLTGNKIALLIDFDNVILGVDDPGFDVEIVVNALRSRGNVVMGRAYGDWYRHHRHRRKLMEQGIELVETPVFGPLIKNSADIRIVLDGFEIAMSQPHINTFCLVSGDSDFLPLIKKLQYLGKHVIVIAGIKFTSDLIRRNCNEYISYENLFAESVGATEDVTTIEGAYTLLERAINTLNERIMDVRSSSVKQMMVQLNPAFSERTFGCSQFKQFLERAERDSRVHLEARDGSAGEMSVYWRDDAPRPEVKAPAPVAQKSSNNGALRHADRTAERPARDLTTARRSGRKFSGRAGGVQSETPAPAAPAPEVETDEPITMDDVVITAQPNGGKPAPASVSSLEDEFAAATPPAGGFVNNLAKRSDLRPGRLRFSAKTGTQTARPLVGAQAAPAAQTEQAVTPEPAATPAGEAPAVTDAANESTAAPAVDESLQQTSDAAAAAEAFEAAAENAPKKKATRRGGRSRKKKDVEAAEPAADGAADSITAETAPTAEASAEPEAPVAESAPEAAPVEAVSLTADADTPEAMADGATLVSGDEGALAAATEPEATDAEEKPKKATRARRGGTKRTTARKKKDADAGDAPAEGA